MASWLVLLSLDPSVWVRSLAEDIVLCSHSAFLHLGEEIGNCNAMGSPVEILLVASCYRNWEKLWSDGPLGLFADFTLPPTGVGGKPALMMKHLLISIFFFSRSIGVVAYVM